ncbi:MAG: hypothetical protein FWC40_06535 [Proteobacteria bacterium]|nr:hypothetical protein [Pseudomonadota bacterium]
MTSPPFTPWPCAHFSDCPLASSWSPAFPKARLSGVGYDRTIMAMRALFMGDGLSQTYYQLRDYCFQQGDVTNANVLDLEFFYHILTHDLAFFLGHRRVEIQNAFPLTPKEFPGIDHLRASHFDFYRVLHPAILGYTTIESLTTSQKFRVYTSIESPPRRHETIFGRVMPVGLLPRKFTLKVVEPWDTIHSDHISDVLSVFQAQYEHFCQRFPTTTRQAFLKISAYHIYELIQAFELETALNQQLSVLGDTLSARTERFIFPDPSCMPKLTEIPGAQSVIGGDGTAIKDLVTAEICPQSPLPQTLREAILSRDKRTLEVTTFLDKAGTAFIQKVILPAIKGAKIIQRTEYLDRNATYRALRHISLK